MSKKALSPILGMVKPLAKQYITQENMQAMFDSIVGSIEPDEGEKVVLMVSRKADGTVTGSVASMRTADHTITGVYAQDALDSIIMNLLQKL